MVNKTMYQKIQHFKRKGFTKADIVRGIGIIILLVLCLTFLLLTCCIVDTANSETAIENIENQENTEEPVSKWSGLGMVVCSDSYVVTVEEYDGWIDTLLENGFTEFRECPTYQSTTWLVSSKSAIIRNVSKGAKYIWGVSSNKFDNPANIITAESWPIFKQAILDNAQWAQDHGVYEFQLGNEEELHVDGITMTVAQIITNLKSVATEVQEIFTNGKVSYTCDANYISDWIIAGKGDIDILASNVYMGGTTFDDGWKTLITNLVNAFGADGTSITEFGPSWTSLDDYSTDEAVQAEAVTEMIEYIKASGTTRAFYFLWYHPDVHMGVLKDDGTYRLLWNQALLNTGPVESTTVPTKTTTISLPDTIAHLYQNNPDSTKPGIYHRKIGNILFSLCIS